MEPSAAGVLEKTPLAHLLVYCLQKQLSGSILLRDSVDPKKVDAITFVLGRPAKAMISEPIEHLGRILIELGKINDAAFNESLTRCGRGEGLQGQILLAMNAIDEDTLSEALRLQVARKVGHMFSRPGTTQYAFYADADVLARYGGPELFPVDPIPLLLVGVRSYPPLLHVRAALDRVGTRLLRVHAEQPTGVSFTRAESLLLQELSKRPMTLDELASLHAMDTETVHVFVYSLLLLHVVESISRSNSQQTQVAPDAAPDLSSRAPVRDAPPPSRARPSQIDLATEPRREEPPPSSSSARDAAFLLEINRKASLLDTINYFALLDLPETVTADTVKNAYFQLVRKWHPDRLRPELRDAKTQVSRVFSKMTEAFNALSDDDKIDAYRRSIATGAKPETAEEESATQRALRGAMAFQKAEYSLRRNSFTEAETYARIAFECDPETPEHVAVWNWLCALKPEANLTECLAAVEGAATKAKSEWVLFSRGMVRKLLGKTDLAVNDFRHVLEINARNIDAAREVRVYEMRASSAKSLAAKTSSMFNSFLRKKGTP